jgi:hypothetical protein
MANEEKQRHLRRKGGERRPSHGAERENETRRACEQEKQREEEREGERQGLA